MVCRVSWGKKESSGENDDENERTRLVEVRPTGPVSSYNGGWTALIDNRQEHQPLSRTAASHTLLYIYVSHLEPAAPAAEAPDASQPPEAATEEEPL